MLGDATVTLQGNGIVDENMSKRIVCMCAFCKCCGNYRNIEVLKWYNISVAWNTPKELMNYS